MYLFVDKLTNVDFSYLHPERGLLGETWLADLGLDGRLDETGMICDFGQVKGRMRQWLDQYLDHRLAIPTLSPALALTETNDQVSFTWQCSRGEISMTAPREAVALINVEEITPETCAQWAIESSKGLLPGAIDRVDLSFNPEGITGPFYHYSHGLKKHDGNCQRIAHGHRSMIAIWLDGERSRELEQLWADRWRDIYIATEEDLQSQSASHFQFRYQAAQGQFELSLAKSHCYLIDSDTTVENIAQHICQQIKLSKPEALVRVKAYEGIGKGAIAEA